MDQQTGAVMAKQRTRKDMTSEATIDVPFRVLDQVCGVCHGDGAVKDTERMTRDKKGELQPASTVRRVNDKGEKVDVVVPDPGKKKKCGTCGGNGTVDMPGQRVFQCRLNERQSVALRQLFDGLQAEGELVQLTAPVPVTRHWHGLLWFLDQLADKVAAK